MYRKKIYVRDAIGKAIAFYKKRNSVIGMERTGAIRMFSVLAVSVKYKNRKFRGA